MTRLRVLSAVVVLSVASGGAFAAGYAVGAPSDQLVECNIEIPPVPPGYPGHNPDRLASRLIYPARGECPEVPNGWSPWDGQTSCEWNADLRMWRCPAAE